MNRTILEITTLALVLLMPITPTLAAGPPAKPSPENQLRIEFLRLRNTDPNITRPQAWADLARALIAAAEKDTARSQQAADLFDAAIMYQQLFDKTKDAEQLAESLRLLNRVADEYPREEIADDALMRSCDLILFEKRDSASAAECYQKVRTIYPDSDMSEAARLRFKELKRGVVKPLQTSEAVSNSTGNIVAVIDPGHGGDDYGAEGQGGLLEKDVTLDVALRLEKLLQGVPGVKVLLTRRSDIFMPLADRTQLANKAGAALFISLHTNASATRALQGLETYYLDNTNDQASKKLAERENRSDNGGAQRSDLDFMLSDLIQNAKLDDSIELANVVQRGTIATMKAHWPALKDLKVKKAPFYVLVGAHMPCILVEMFFIDHDQDGSMLGEKDFRQDLAFGLLRGIEGYLDHHARRGAKESAAKNSRH